MTLPFCWNSREQFKSQPVIYSEHEDIQITTINEANQKVMEAVKEKIEEEDKIDHSILFRKRYEDCYHFMLVLAHIKRNS